MEAHQTQELNLTEEQRQMTGAFVFYALGLQEAGEGPAEYNGVRIEPARDFLLHEECYVAAGSLMWAFVQLGKKSMQPGASEEVVNDFRAKCERYRSHVVGMLNISEANPAS